MENKEEKKQNNRRLDEKIDSDSKENSPSKEKEWDPSSDLKQPAAKKNLPTKNLK